MMRSVNDCAHHVRSDRPVAWRNRLLAFFGAAVVGLLAPAGCVVAPDAQGPTSESFREILWGPNQGSCRACDPPCGAACDECDSPACEGSPECAPPCKRRWLHWPHCHLYDPEAGIFNFCIPPQCINEPPPLPPGRFFPVPVRPAFAPRQLSTYAPPNAM
jgi:hypothetical protein